MTVGASRQGGADGPAGEQGATRPLTTPSGLSPVERLEMVRDIAGRVADSRDLPGVLAAVDLAARERLGAGAVSIGLIDEVAGTMATLSATGFTEWTELLLSTPVVLDEN